MNEEEYEAKALRTEHTPCVILDLDVSRLLHAALGAITEAAELVDLLKQHIIYKKPIDRLEVLKELGDMHWYWTLGVKTARSTPGEVRAINIAKLEARYGGEFSTIKALTRNIPTEDEAAAAVVKGVASE